MPEDSATSTLTLTDFLLARIAEDEKIARRMNDEGKIEITFPLDESESFDLRAFTPARLLPECEAKRRIVELRATAAYHADTFASAPADDPFRMVYTTSLSTYDAVLRSLALPYADHPDYREEWKP